ncbi:hypothetical protein XHV734_0199 [Xanthomonas hortorum pv. vitians]|nr:hypothetical protein XHV734_0199 [Xanthomonas hortorum pv. vitians]
MWQIAGLPRLVCKRRVSATSSFSSLGTWKGDQGKGDSSHNPQQRQHAKNYRIQTPGKTGATLNGSKNGDRN